MSLESSVIAVPVHGSGAVGASRGTQARSFASARPVQMSPEDPRGYLTARYSVPETTRLPAKRTAE